MTFTGELFVEKMTAAELSRASAVELVLPALKAKSGDIDHTGEFYLPHVQTLSNAGLLGLMVPTAYGGLGGGLRDLCAAAFAMGSACPSTAMCYYFQCCATSPGRRLLQAIDNNLFTEQEAACVKPWAERLLNMIGFGGKWLGNFTGEGATTEKAQYTADSVATKVDNGYVLNGVKSFASAYGVADHYLVTACLEGHTGLDGLCAFIVDGQSNGLDRRIKWDALGMRGSATDGLVMKNVFVAEQDSLPVPGAFSKSLDMGRSTFVGNQIAGRAVYLGIAYSVYRHSVSLLNNKRLKNSGKPGRTDPSDQQLLGKIITDYHTATLWLRRQLELETAEPALLPKQEVIQFWKLCEGQVAECCFSLATNALKVAGLAGALSDSVTNQALREMAMGLVQAPVTEQGYLEVASSEIL